MKVNVGSKEDCWLWKANLNENEYGIMTKGKTQMRAHRLSFLIQFGYLPDHPLVLRHICDTQKCVNPFHLLPGTHADNNADQRSRGRSFVPKAGMVFGEEHPFAKLDDEKVLEIHARLDAGEEKAQDIAKEFDVSDSVMSNIRRGRGWKHLSLKDLGHGNAKSNRTWARAPDH